MDAQIVEQELWRRRWEWQSAGWRSQHEFEAKVFESSVAEGATDFIGDREFQGSIETPTEPRELDLADELILKPARRGTDG
jgi:hypothetical protein